MLEQNDEMDLLNSDISLITQENYRAKTCRILGELLDTENIYVEELHSILTGYRDNFFAAEMQDIVPTHSTEVINVIFGNLDEIYHFHSNFLKDLTECIDCTGRVASCFIREKDNFYQLYSNYCQNLSASEQVRDNLVDSYMFFETCQKKLGHKLPLAAYLLKPVQRITKYHLLLRDLLQYLDDSKSTQQALECMLVVLKLVNDSMHQVTINGLNFDLSKQGQLLLHGEFSVWTENKKDIRLRLKPARRHVFLHQRSMIFCKSVPKTSHNKSVYQFKFHLRLSHIGLTESVKGDTRKFEVWLRGRAEVYILQATDVDQKQTWVSKIKRVLLDQLEELKDEKIKEYAQSHRCLRQTTSWDTTSNSVNHHTNSYRALSCDSEMRNYHYESEFSDGSNSEDEEHLCHTSAPGGRYLALADYFAAGASEVNMKEGDVVELHKIGCAGWWYIKVCGTSLEGWAPAAYLQSYNRRISDRGARSQE